MSASEAAVLGAVWGLVRAARESGEIRDEWALAALIDAETELEGLLDLPALEPPDPLDPLPPAREALRRALALLRGLPTPPGEITRWVADAAPWERP